MRSGATTGSMRAASSRGSAWTRRLARNIKAKVREALIVDADDWKEKVYARGADFTLKGYRGLTSEIRSAAELWHGGDGRA